VVSTHLGDTRLHTYIEVDDSFGIRSYTPTSQQVIEGKAAEFWRTGRKTTHQVVVILFLSTGTSPYST
jgi:hypothetical protein